MFTIRLAGPGATGAGPPRYATSASTSKPGAVTRPVPTVSLVKPSPPLARKSFVVTLYEVAGSIGHPAERHVARPAHQAARRLLYAYGSRPTTCRMRWVVCPAKPDELLLQHLLELGAGEGLGDHQVVERLHGEALAVRHLTGGLAAGGVGEGQRLPDAARVHQRDLGARADGCTPAARRRSRRRAGSRR